MQLWRIFHKIFPILWKLDLIWREFQSQPKARSKKLKQTSQLGEVPVRCLSRDFLFSCTRCAGPCNSLRAANSRSQSSHSPDITLPVHYNCKFCVKPKENITSTITGIMLLEAETQEIFLSARCSHCPGNTSKYVFPQVMNHRGTEGRAYFFSFVQQITFLIS